MRCLAPHRRRRCASEQRTREWRMERCSDLSPSRSRSTLPVVMGAGTRAHGEEVYIAADPFASATSGALL